MTNIYEKVGKNIRKFRKEAGITQEKLAEKAKIEPRSVIEIEQGKRNPTLKTLNKVTKALGINVNDLLN